MKPREVSSLGPSFRFITINYFLSGLGRIGTEGASGGNFNQTIVWYGVKCGSEKICHNIIKASSKGAGTVGNRFSSDHCVTALGVINNAPV